MFFIILFNKWNFNELYISSNGRPRHYFRVWFYKRTLMSSWMLIFHGQIWSTREVNFALLKHLSDWEFVIPGFKKQGWTSWIFRWKNFSVDSLSMISIRFGCSKIICLFFVIFLIWRPIFSIYLQFQEIPLPCFSRSSNLKHLTKSFCTKVIHTEPNMNFKSWTVTYLLRQ